MSIYIRFKDPNIVINTAHIIAVEDDDKNPDTFNIHVIGENYFEFTYTAEGFKDFDDLISKLCETLEGDYGPA
jgi:hypothetical protein